ncbi:MAG: ABC transporter ATP-binding protein [Candidatus Eremiobacteraeota bacterium]|nr:ABC transporter ATP-binding protein [Candidatus Eremiobacteraeota bacterium]
MTSVLPTRLPDADLAVVTRGLGKRYGAQTALRELALQVPRGAVFLLVGPNGAGKSTTLKLLLDLVRPDEGDAELFGLAVRENGPRLRASVGYVPERHDWGYGWMTVGRLLAHHARFYPSWDEAYGARLSTIFELQPERPMRKLSKGQSRRVHLVMALAHRPPMLLLDEPTDGLDPLMRDETLGVLAEHLAETPTTVLLSTHHVAEVEAMADYIAVLRNGELRAQPAIAELHRGLHRYQADVPEGWSGAPALNGSVLRRVATPRQVQWTVWGTPAGVERQLAQSGATLRDASPLSLHDATLALLNKQVG